MIRRCLYVIFLLAVAFQFTHSQQPGEISYNDISVMPEGKKGERIQSLIETINANDPEMIKKLLKEGCTQKFLKMAPLGRHIQVLLGFRMQTGGLDFQGIRTYVPERKNETVVILKDRNFDSWRAFTLSFKKTEQLLIDSLELLGHGQTVS